jgi:hypothetical protein
MFEPSSKRVASFSLDHVLPAARRHPVSGTEDRLRVALTLLLLRKDRGMRQRNDNRPLSVADAELPLKAAHDVLGLFALARGE